jgi:UDP-sugar transporter A1/2/3
MLRKRLALNQWISLILLMIGITLVQWPETYSNNNNNHNSSNKLEESIKKVTPEEELVGNRLIGLLAVLASCFSSGFSGVYFEKLVKFSSQSLWIRNTQLALFGVIVGLIAMFLQDFDSVYVNGFFQVFIRNFFSFLKLLFPLKKLYFSQTVIN